MVATPFFISKTLPEELACIFTLILSCFFTLNLLFTQPFLNVIQALILLMYGYVLKRILIGPVLRILKYIGNSYQLIINRELNTILLFLASAASILFIVLSILFQKVFPYRLICWEKAPAGTVALSSAAPGGMRTERQQVYTVYSIQ